MEEREVHLSSAAPLRAWRLLRRGYGVPVAGLKVVQLGNRELARTREAT
jgi:hypothetical protein